MWTDTKPNARHPGGGADGLPGACYQPVSPEVVACYIARGHHLRAQAIARMARQGLAKLRGLIGQARHGELPAEASREDPLSVLASDFRSPLTAIRSSAEILRDNPDMDSVKLRRFVDIVLAEEARLEALVSRMLDAANSERGSRDWQLELDNSNLGQAHGSCP
jgi:signal transduction histidine kinase